MRDPRDPNTYFDKIYVLNLERRPDRYRKMQLKLQKVGLHNVVFMAAEDGETEHVKNQLQVAKTNNPQCEQYGLRTPGAMGCLLSHINILLDAKKKGYQQILILEDDVIFHKNFNADISKIHAVDGYWKLLYLGSSQYDWDGIEYHGDDFYFAKRSQGTFAYAVHHSAYDDLLKIFYGYGGAVDYLLGYEAQKMWEGECFVLRENLIIADVGDSDIREPRHRLKHPIKLGWDYRKYDHKINIQDIVVGVTTYNRLSYLKQFLETFEATRNPNMQHRVIIADDGSTDGSREYVIDNWIGKKDFEVHLICNERAGIAKQTNTIFEEMQRKPFDFGFKCDDDIFFLQSGWEGRYIDAYLESALSHLVYYNTEWKRSMIEPLMLPGSFLQSHTDVENCMGCFYTITPFLLQTCGAIDEGFGFHGYEHIDFSARACGRGLNYAGSLFDAYESEKFIGMQSRVGYINSLTEEERIALVPERNDAEVKNSIKKRNYLVSRSKKRDRLLSILIPTLEERKVQYQRLFFSLTRQIEKGGYADLVEIKSYKDNRELSTGAKRNYLIEMAGGEYVAFIDDDDSVASNYVKMLVEAIQDNPNTLAVTFNAIAMINGTKEADISFKAEHWKYSKKAKQWNRPPGHLNAIRYDIVYKHQFAEVTIGEDRDWSQRLANQEIWGDNTVHIDKVLYYYDRSKRRVA